MRSKLTQASLVFGLSAALALAPSGGGAQPTNDGPNIRYVPKGDGQQPGGRPSRDPQGHWQRDHGLSTGEKIGIGIGVVAIGCALFCGRHHEPDDGRRPDDTDDAPDSRDLLRNGPHVSDTTPFGAYAVYGFVQNGWPIVIDYDSDPQAAVWITVTVGDKQWTQGLEGGRHYVNIPYKGGSARQAAPALFVIQSAVRGADPPLASRLDIIGIGAGPRAVGSVAIHDLQFAASARELGGDFARYGYQASSPFNRAAAEIVRFQRDPNARTPTIVATQVASYDRTAVLAGPFGPGSWDGREAKSHRPSIGLHRLQVRGWETDADVSWVSALSTGSVFIK